MSAKHTITINGKLYDAITGLPANFTTHQQPVAVQPVKPVAATEKSDVSREPAHHSAGIHQHVQKSTTLRRGHLNAPKSNATVSAPVRHTAEHIAKSPMITHFANHPKPLPKQRSSQVINDIGPIARRAVTAPSTATRLPSSEIKKRLIAQAGEKVGSHLQHAHAAAQKQPAKKGHLRIHHLVAASLAVVLLMGYITYLNMPGLSVRLAAAQSGIDAKYPTFSPDGYSFAGPVAFQQGQVELHFKANGGGEGYTIHQQLSDWNSVAVLDNLVNKASNGDYETNSEGGITVYTYGTNAAWTNGGVLYTIDGKAPLSNEQLLHIASSM